MTVRRPKPHCPIGPAISRARLGSTSSSGTLQEYKRDNLTGLAAALTYYGVLAIFPMIIVVVSLLGLIGRSATQPLIENLGKVAPGPAKQIITSAIHNVQSGKGTAGLLFVLGLALALWSASGYIAAFMRASNVVWDIAEEDRSGRRPRFASR